MPRRCQIRSSQFVVIILFALLLTAISACTSQPSPTSPNIAAAQATITAQQTQIAALQQQNAPSTKPAGSSTASAPTPAPAKASPSSAAAKAQIATMPWAQLSLGGLVEGQAVAPLVFNWFGDSKLGSPDQGFKWIGGSFWVKNLTSLWQNFGGSGGFPGRVTITDSGDAEHQAIIQYSPEDSDNFSGIVIPPNAAVRFGVWAQVPAARQPITLTLSGGPFQLNLAYTQGNVPTGLFEKTTDFPDMSTPTTLVCPGDRSIAVKFRNVSAPPGQFPSATFDMQLHNSGGHAIGPGDYAILREAWSPRGIFERTRNNHGLVQIGGMSIPPDQDGTGSVGVFLPRDFSGGGGDKGVVVFPQLVRMTISPNSQRKANQPACDKKDMLFRVAGP